MTSGKDKRIIASKLTGKRLVNLVGLQLSYLLTKWFRFSFKPPLPFALSIEPTTACNLACPECPSGLKAFTRPTGKLDLMEHEVWLKQLAKHVFYINYYFQGEPFLHPQFLQLIEAANRHKIYTATSTNAHFITAEKAKEIVHSGLNRLIISVDGLSQETYSQYRVNGSLSKVIEGSKHLVAARKQAGTGPYLIFQFLVVRGNEHEVAGIFELANELGIDEVRLKTAQLYDFKNGNELMPENETYSRYIKQRDGTYRFKYKGGNHCWRMWSSSVITWDGKVVPCCFDKDAQHTLGDLKTQTFAAVWQNPSYIAFRKQVFTARDSIEICTNCSEGAKVWVD